MNTIEKYRKAIASRPSNEELKYWASLDTLADEKAKAAFDAALAEEDKKHQAMREETQRMLAELMAGRKTKSNGTTFEQWSDEFMYYMCNWYEVPNNPTMFIEKQETRQACMESMYNKDISPGVAVLNYAEECGWETETEVEIRQQRETAETWLATMRRADEIHGERLANVRWMPEEEAKKAWHERKYAK